MKKGSRDDRLFSSILDQDFPEQLRRITEPALRNINFVVYSTFPKMLEKYQPRMEVKPPLVMSYPSNITDSAFYGYVKQVTPQEEESPFAIMIDQGELFNLQMLVDPYYLLEKVGGLVGTVIRWNLHPPPQNYIPSLEQEFIEKTQFDRSSEEDRKKSREFRKVGFFFEWTGRHTFRDVIDPTWPLEHEAYETDEKPFLEKSRKKYTERFTEAVKKVEELNKSTRNSRQDFNTWRQKAEKILEESKLGYLSLDSQSDDFFERLAYNQLFINFPIYGYDVKETWEDDFRIFEECYEEKRDSFLEHYAKGWPNIFKDLLGKPVSKETLFERFFKLRRSTLQEGLQIIAKNIENHSIETWFDVAKPSRYEISMMPVFRAAEKHEKILLENLPNIVKMTDEEVKSKFLSDVKY